MSNITFISWKKWDIWTSRTYGVEEISVIFSSKRSDKNYFVDETVAL